MQFYNVAVQHVNHYATETRPFISLCVFLLTYEYQWNSFYIMKPCYNICIYKICMCVGGVNCDVSW